MARAQFRGAQAQAFDRAGGEVLQEHVGLRQQAGEDLLCPRVLHVQCKAFLRAVGPDEM
ncbi:hypothetical protein D3C83_45680 [compost metagenome]